ncbi:GDP-mannose 4,6-dehydratase, partial [candidate division KSB1 bacterium]|nr:GDP-mannose 4,6-dehydratase [candidate division KSB1 bacterium]
MRRRQGPSSPPPLHRFRRRRRVKQRYVSSVIGSFLIRILNKIRPDEIYNLAAQSHVGVSFEKPGYTTDADAVGVLHILEAIRILGLEDKVKFYQASSSEMFGASSPPQNEDTYFHPRSPYGIAKL